MSIDLNFRPTSYADFDDPVALALNGIKGQRRREMVRDMLTTEGEQRETFDALLGPIEDGILEEDAPEGFVQNLNQSFGPSWLGGEYLPNLGRGEAEIARIVIQSVLLDVYSVRARFTGSIYHYRFVDEDGGRYRIRPRTSKRPLTLRKLVHLIDTVRWGEDDDPVVEESQLEKDEDDIDYDQYPWVEGWWWQQWHYEEPLEECTDFARVESEQYPDLANYYEERAAVWREAREDGGTRDGR